MKEGVTETFDRLAEHLAKTGANAAAKPPAQESQISLPS
jgi:hypothetical protein